MAAQKFGGKWSLIKVEKVEEYLSRFTMALKDQRFRKVYIDAFAGTGSFAYVEGGLPLFSEQAASKERQGSATRATLVSPPFDHLYFIDTSEKLEELKGQLGASASGRATFLPGDANERVSEVCRTLTRKDRGVIFLDPFGMNLEWATLEAIRRTEILDVWYLFPLMGAARQAAREWTGLDASKANALTRVLGTEDWEKRFYELPSPSAPDLFDLAPVQPYPIRKMSVRGIDDFVRERLRDVFPYVAPHPLHLLGPKNAPLFSLFFAVSNPSERAWGLASRIAEGILRRRS